MIIQLVKQLSQRDFGAFPFGDDSVGRGRPAGGERKAAKERDSDAEQAKNGSFHKDLREFSYCTIVLWLYHSGAGGKNVNFLQEVVAENARSLFTNAEKYAIF